MDEMITSDEHVAEIAALNREIYELSCQLEECREINLRKSTVDPDSPFDNPTDYKGFYGDYTETQPLIQLPGYRMTLEPDRNERKKLRRSYAVGGFCLIFWFVVNLGLSMLLNRLVGSVMSSLNPDVSPVIIDSYARTTSILASMNILIMPFCNVLTALTGFKMGHIDGKSVVRTRNFGFGKAIQYCLIAVFIWLISIYSYALLGDVLEKYGKSGYVDTSDIGMTPLGNIIFTIYQCILAPITEELLMRGMLLRVFSKANQRFGIFATAAFFGLIHGNAAQFIFAFLIGIFLAHITLKHNSIIPAVIVHIFINSFSLLYSMFGGGSADRRYISFIVIFTLAIIGMTMLLAFHGDDKLPATTPQQSRRGLPVALTSFAFCGASGLFLLYNIINLISSKA